MPVACKDKPEVSGGSAIESPPSCASPLLYGSDKVTYTYSDGRVTEIDDLTTTIGDVRYTWSQNGDVTVTGPDFEVRWQSSNGYITYYRHDQYNPVVHFRMVVKPNGVVETASADTNHHYTFVPYTNAAATGPASVPVSNLATSYAGPTTAGTKLELKDNTTPYYRYVDNYSRDGGVTNPEVYVLNYNLDSNFGGGYTGAMMAQKSKLNRFVIWDDKVANKPLVFANDIEFIRDTQDHLSLYVDGASFNGTVYGTEYGNIDKSSPYWAAWISALEGNDDAIQYYKVKGSDGQGGTDVVINCRPVSVLGPPSSGKKLAYDEAVIENGINKDKVKVISADGYDKYYGNIIADDDGYNDEYLFRVYRNGQYYYYRSETKPVQFVNFAVKAPAKPKNLVEENISTSWVKKTIDAIKGGFGVSATNTTAVTQGEVTEDELLELMYIVIMERKILYWNHSMHDPMQGKAVVALQKLLGNVEVTGIFKQATENAIEQFQKENGLKVTGRVDFESAVALIGIALDDPLGFKPVDLKGWKEFFNRLRGFAGDSWRNIASKLFDLFLTTEKAFNMETVYSHIRSSVANMRTLVTSNIFDENFETIEKLLNEKKYRMSSEMSDLGQTPATFISIGIWINSGLFDSGIDRQALKMDRPSGSIKWYSSPGSPITYDDLVREYVPFSHNLRLVGTLVHESVHWTQPRWIPWNLQRQQEQEAYSREIDFYMNLADNLMQDYRTNPENINSLYKAHIVKAWFQTALDGAFSYTTQDTRNTWTNRMNTIVDVNLPESILPPNYLPEV